MGRNDSTLPPLRANERAGGGLGSCVEELGHMRYGVDQARRVWCEARDIANTLDVKAFRTLIQK